MSKPLMFADKHTQEDKASKNSDTFYRSLNLVIALGCGLFVMYLIDQLLGKVFDSNWNYIEKLIGSEMHKQSFQDCVARRGLKSESLIVISNVHDLSEKIWGFDPYNYLYSGLLLCSGFSTTLSILSRFYKEKLKFIIYGLLLLTTLPISLLNYAEYDCLIEPWRQAILDVVLVFCGLIILCQCVRLKVFQLEHHVIKFIFIFLLITFSIYIPGVYFYLWGLYKINFLGKVHISESSLLQWSWMFALIGSFGVSMIPTFQGHILPLINKLVNGNLHRRLITIKTEAGTGSGILLNNQGLIISCHHNFFNNKTDEEQIIKEISIRTSLGTWFDIQCSKNLEFCFNKEKYDDLKFDDVLLFRLKLDKNSDQLKNLPPLLISKDVNKGDEVTIIAWDNVYDTSLIEHSGKVITVEPATKDHPNRFHVKVDGYPGYSGGGVFKNGQLIGIINYIQTQRQNNIIASFIPNYIADYISKEIDTN